MQTPRALGSRARAASVDGQLEAEIAAETEAEVESMQVSQAALATREEQATAEEQLLAQAAAHASQLRSEAVGAKPQQSDAPHDAGAADGGGGSSPRGGGPAGKKKGPFSPRSPPFRYSSPRQQRLRRDALGGSL